MADADVILTSVKLGLGIQSSDSTFDTQLVNDINSVLMILFQLGVGPQDDPFQITGVTEEWSTFLDTEEAYLAAVKSYMVKKVQRLFDPPTSGIVTQANKEVLDELEYRLLAQVETKETTV